MAETMTRVLRLAVATMALAAAVQHASAAPKLPKLKKVPRYTHMSEKAESRIERQLPVVLEGTKFIEPAMKWSVEYLQQHWKSEEPVESLVTSGKTKAGKYSFLYTARHKVGQYNLGQFVHNEEAVTQNVTTIGEFLERRDERAADGVGQYIQYTFQVTDLPDDLGEQIKRDMKGFNWKLPDYMKTAFGWYGGKKEEDDMNEEDHLQSRSNADRTLQFWIGDRQHVTPLHYDVVSSLFCQARGMKKVYLFPPSEFHKLCPTSWLHPSPRGSQATDLQNIPSQCAAFSKIKDGLVVTLSPGDVLYIPQGWWHHLEQVDDEPVGISAALHYRPGDFLRGRPMVNSQDFMRRRVEVDSIVLKNLVDRFGGPLTVKYMQGIAKGIFNSSSGSEPPEDIAKVHEEIYPELEGQLQLMKVLKPTETALKFLKAFAKGRFDQPTTDNPAHHISEFAHDVLATKEQEERQKRKQKSSGRIEL